MILAPLAALALLAAEFFPFSAVTSEPQAQTALRAHFTLAESCLRVSPWQQEPLRVPWVPLSDLVEGPPALAKFRRPAKVSNIQPVAL